MPQHKSKEAGEAGAPVIPSIRRVDEHSSRSSGRPAFRPARPDDVPACMEVWAAAMSDLQLRLNQPAVTGDLGPLGRLLAHVRETDPERFWVATRTDGAPRRRDGRRELGGLDGPPRFVGFVSATIRGEVWFLAMLFVRPEEQAAGLGQALLRQVLGDTAGPEGESATAPGDGRDGPGGPRSWRP